MLRRLDGVARGRSTRGVDRFAAERLLGRRTGELHVALGAVEEPGFAPEMTDRRGDRRGHAAHSRRDRRDDRAAAGAHARISRRRSRAGCPKLSRGCERLSERAEGYRDEVGTAAHPRSWRLSPRSDAANPGRGLDDHRLRGGTGASPGGATADERRCSRTSPACCGRLPMRGASPSEPRALLLTARRGPSRRLGDRAPATRFSRGTGKRSRRDGAAFVPADDDGIRPRAGRLGAGQGALRGRLRGAQPA